jgi:hypothetical protein
MRNANNLEKGKRTVHFETSAPIVQFVPLVKSGELIHQLVPFYVDSVLVERASYDPSSYLSI